MRAGVAVLIGCSWGAAVAWGAPVYLGALNPQGIPDIAQDALAICGAASAANILWEWDRHAPYDGSAAPKPRLVPRTDGNWPAGFGSWVQDGRSLRNALAVQIYGANYGQPNPTGGHGMGGGITRYIDSRSHLYNSGFWPLSAGNPTGLSVHVYNGNGVTYAGMKNKLLNASNEPLFSSAIVNIDWRQADGTRITRNDRKILHSLGVAGFDTANTDLYLTNGWGDHENQANPVSTGYYDHYTGVVTDNSGNDNPNSRIRIPANANNDDLVGLPARYNPPSAAAAYCEVYQMIEIKRGGSPSVGLEVGPAESPGANQFTYSVHNDEPNAQKHFFLELPQFALSLATNVGMPVGWAVETWNPGGTIADPTGLNTDGQLLFGSFTNDEAAVADPREVAPAFTGLHFYYMGADSFGGIPTSGIGEFSFDLSASVPWSYENTWLTVVGEAGNEADYFNMIGGPVIPEPGTGGMVIVGMALLRRVRRRPA
jgi:hypothetical protein